MVRDFVICIHSRPVSIHSRPVSRLSLTRPETSSTLSMDFGIVLLYGDTGLVRDMPPIL